MDKTEAMVIGGALVGGIINYFVVSSKTNVLEYYVPGALIGGFFGYLFSKT